jgi:hypothetical protein
VTACTRPRRPRLATRLPQLELDIELSRIELGYRAAMAMEIEHIRPDLVWHRAEMAVRIARHRQAAAAAALAGAYGRQPVVYLLHFDRRYRHAGHYTGKSESSAFLKAGSADVGGGFVELAGAAARLGYVGWVVRVRRGEARRRPRCG